VIDLGSNTVLLLVVERDGGVVVDEAHVTRLSEGLFKRGELQAPARERTLEVVCELAHRARHAGAERVVAVATEALRTAREGSAFLTHLVTEAGLDEGRVLAAEEEAAFAIESHRRADCGDFTTICVIDVGGGSTEIVWVRGDGGPDCLSLPLGSVRLTEANVRSDPPSVVALGGMRGDVEVEVSGVPLAAVARELESGGEVVAVAGTATTLAALDLSLPAYDRERVEGHLMTPWQVYGWIERLAALSVAERRRLPGMDPGRADIIVAGLMTLHGVLEALAVPRFRVSGRGVRYGVALQLLEGPGAVW
jgi:exopolyphosphatase/guanosine-5'-triphosphate,3'-diphosphate pyrophosphatase